MKIRKFNENVDNDWSANFDSFIDIIYDIYDDYKNIDITFETADGSRKFLNICNYKKGVDYDRFITALGGMTVDFKVKIDIKDNDLNVFIEIIKIIKSDRMSSTDWVLKNFNCKHLTEFDQYKRGYYMIEALFRWSDESVHGTRSTYRLTGE